VQFILWSSWNIATIPPLRRKRRDAPVGMTEHLHASRDHEAWQLFGWGFFDDGEVGSDLQVDN
jgi:hypothetical protein